MRRQQLGLIAITLVLVSAGAVAARAQEQPRARTRRSGTMIISNGERTDTIRLGERRGRLGINVDMRPDASRDSVGALVAGTTPNSPASRAGVQVGDIVTRFNGTPLAVTDGRSGGGDDDQSRPALRLINLASRLNPGDTVRLDLRRGTQNVSATLVAAESDMDEMIGRMRLPDMMEFGGALRMPGEPGGPGGMMRTFVFGGSMTDLELVRVNPGLGEYFGTQEGLLVVSVGSDTALGLRAGDVILTIGGRKAASPPQAMRILGTYEPNEAVQFEVMRQHRRTSVSGKIPPASEHGWSVHHGDFELDMPMPEWNRALEGWNRAIERMPNIELMLPRMKVRPRGLIRVTGEV